jgi:hypothetical protein
MPMKFKKAVKGRRFNSKQIEGLAKLLDGLAQAFIIGLTIGSTTSTTSLSLLSVFVFFGCATVFVVTATLLRGMKE